MSYEFLKVEIDGPIYRVTINRPERMNAMHPPASNEMDRAFDAFRDNPEARVAVLTGAGERAFSAGNDLKYQAEQGSESFDRHPATGFGGISNRFDIDKPVIAAVNGIAMGGGLEMALACDIIIAAEEAIVALPEPRVGLAALGGGLHRLPRSLPMKQAMGMILTGRHVPAPEAMAMGMFSTMVPRAQLAAEVDKWVGWILECSPASLRASKIVARETFENGGLVKAMNEKYQAIVDLYASPDFIEGPKAFAEKRKPNWA